MELINNWLTDTVMGKTNAEYVSKLRQVRSSARKLMRSGHPAVRADAEKVFYDAGRLIVETMKKDMREQS